MKTTASSCGFVGAGTVTLVIASLMVRDPAQMALWGIAGASLLVTVGMLSVLRDLPSRSDPPRRG
jgi:hypothetical protein